MESLSEIRSISKQLLEALAYLHSQRIVHQDLKPPNVLFDKDHRVLKLCDFGISNRVEQTRATQAARSGSIRFMAPEQLDDQLSNKADIWAFGCILFQVITGIVPYKGLSSDFKIWSECQAGGPLVYCQKTDQPISFASPDLKRILERALTVDHTKRPSAEELLRDPFFV